MLKFKNTKKTINVNIKRETGRKKTHRANKYKLLHNGGRYLGKGSYGCIVTPAISCSNKNINIKNTNLKSKLNSKLNSNKTVSKIIIKPDDFIKEEIKISKKINNLDPKQKYFISFTNYCILKKIPNNRTNTVSVKYNNTNDNSNIDSNSSNSNGDSHNKYKILDKSKKKDKRFCPIDLKLKPYNLIMPYAGFTLFDLLNKTSNPNILLIKQILPNNFKECFKNLLIGLYKLHLSRIINRDIKTENITVKYNNNTKKLEMRYIDFGLSEYLNSEITSSYDNIYYSGTVDYISIDIIITYYIYKYYGKHNDYIFQKIKKFIKINDIKNVFISIKENNLLNKLDKTIYKLIEQIYSQFENHTLLENYYGTNNIFNGYLQKSDVYALGLTMYELLTLITKFINVKKDLKLHNLLLNMINFNPNERYNVLDCLKHPYFT